MAKKKLERNIDKTIEKRRKGSQTLPTPKTPEKPKTGEKKTKQ